MLYEALTGELPVTAPSLPELIERKRSGQIRPPRELAPDIDDQLDRLCVALLHPDPGRRPDAQQIRLALRGNDAVVRTRRSPVSPVESAAFVGREREIAALLGAMADAQSGRTVTVAVSGPPGVGKSALVAAACERMRAEHGAIVLAGRCYQTESVPFKALDAVVDELARCLDTVGAAADDVLVLPDDIGALCELFPVLRSSQLVTAAVARDPAPAPPHLVRLRAQVALRQLVEALARTGPIAIVVDDLQWGDHDSEPFLRELIESPRSPGALIIATCRIDFDRGDNAGPTLPGALLEATPVGAERDLRALALGPLERSDATELVATIAGPGHAGSVDKLLDDAGGNPLFIAELAYAVRSGVVVEGHVGLDALLERRIDALSHESQLLLQATAVAAWPQPLTLLSRALQLEGEASALAELRATRMVRVLDSRDGELLTTHHDRVRETAVGRLSDQARRRLHRKLARAFERAAEPDVEALAAHWDGAGDTTRAGRYALEAADRAFAARAFRRAAHQYGRALALSELDDRDRVSLAASRADSLFLAGAVRAAADAYDQVSGFAHDDDVAQLRAQGLICLLRAGDIAAADRLARSFGAAIGVGVPQSSVGALASISWRRLALAVRAPRFHPTSRSVSAPLLRGMAVAKHVSAALGFTDTLRGFAVHTRYLRTALRAGDPKHVTSALVQEALYVTALRGAAARPRVDALLAEATRAAEATGNDAYTAMVSCCRNIADYLSMARLRDCGQRLDALVRRMEPDLDLGWEADIGRIYAVNARGRAGAISVLSERLPILMKRARDAGNEYLREQLSRQVGVQVHLAHDSPERAYELLEGARPSDVGQVTVNTFYFEMHYAEVQAYEGAWSAAADRMERLWSAMSRTSVARVTAARCWTVYVLGRTSAVAAITDRIRRDHYLSRARRMARELDDLRRKVPTMSRALAAQLRSLLAAVRGEVWCVRRVSTRCVERVRALSVWIPGNAGAA